MADHYKSLSHSGDGSKPFFPDPLETTASSFEPTRRLSALYTNPAPTQSPPGPALQTILT